MLYRLLCLAVVISFFAGPVSASESDSSGAQPLASDQGSADYVLQPSDLIQVVVFQEPDLERQVRLSRDSAITLPLIGNVDLKNKTVREAQNLIHDLYDRDYLVNPQINVTVVAYSKVTVNVLGSVDKPGSVDIPPDRPLNLIDAITQAGGFTRLADRKRIKLSRVGPDGKTSTAIINADEIIQSQSADQWELKKGDVIYVPERIL